MANEKKMDQLILGLLSHETLTGYEIKGRIDTMLKYFWSGSYGSIYPTLNELEKEQMITGTSTIENGRNKKSYTITEQGRKRLKEWLELPVTKDEMRYETLLKLFFGSEIGSEVTISHIQNFEDKINLELPILEKNVELLSHISQQEEAHKYFMLTAMFGTKVYKAYLEWCEEAKDLLTSENGGHHETTKN